MSDERKEQTGEQEAVQPEARDEKRNPLATEGLKKKQGKKSLSRKARIWVALAGVAAMFGLAVLAIFVLVPEPEVYPEYEYVDKTIVGGLTRADVDEVIIQRADGTMTLCRDEEGAYFVREAPKVLLNQQKAQDVFQSAASLSYTDLVDEAPSDLSLFGLDTPQARAICKYKDGTRREFLVGDALGIGSTYYLMEDGKPTVYTVWTNVGNNFSSTLASLRETILVAPDVESLRFVQIEQEGQPTLELFYDEDKDRPTMALWKLRQPYAVDADWDRADEFARSTAQLAVREFVEDTEDPAKLKEYGLDEPAARVTVRDVEGVEYDILLGKAASNYATYAMESGKSVVFTVDTSKLGFLSTKPLALVYRFSHIVKIDVLDGFIVEAPSMATPTMKFDITRKAAFDEKGDRKMNAANQPVFDEFFALNGKDVEEKALKTLYQGIIGLQIDDERTRDIASGAQPVLTIRFQLRDGAGEIVAKYYPYDRDFFALDLDGQQNFIIMRKSVDKLIADLEAYAAENK